MTESLARSWAIPTPTPPWLPWLAFLLVLVATGLLARAITCGL